MVGVKDKFERLNMWEAFLYDKQSKLPKNVHKLSGEYKL